MSCDIAATTQAAIDTYGRTATLKRTILGTYDPVLGTEGNSVVINYLCKAVQVDPDKSSFASSYEIGDQVVDIAAASIDVIPDITTDILMFGLNEWRIMGVDTKYIGETKIRHRMHLKQ